MDGQGLVPERHKSGNKLIKEWLWLARSMRGGTMLPQRRKGCASPAIKEVERDWRPRLHKAQGRGQSSDERLEGNKNTIRH
jgi:hypothetical protein